MTVCSSVEAVGLGGQNGPAQKLCIEPPASTLNLKPLTGIGFRVKALNPTTVKP